MVDGDVMAVVKNARSRSDPLETCSDQGRGMEGCDGKLLVWLVRCRMRSRWAPRGQAGQHDDNSTTISGTWNYREKLSNGHVRDEKHTYQWKRAICASSQDWAGWLAG